VIWKCRDGISTEFESQRTQDGGIPSHQRLNGKEWVHRVKWPGAITAAGKPRILSPSPSSCSLGYDHDVKKKGVVL
jgi:hypothetical protein